MSIRDFFSIIIAMMVVTSSVISFFPLGKMNIAAEPGDVISTLLGSTADDKFGWNVSNAGDVNGDGIEDIIVGAPGYNSDQGRAYIFFGGNSLFGNLDAENADVILNGSFPNALFGWDVSGAGDFNGDGFNDTIVCAPGNDSNRGAAYIFYGSSSLSGTITSNNANITINGENLGDFFGSSVSELGDVSKETPIDHVVISEVYANAVDETSPDIGEFMELYNPTSSPVLLNNWIIEDFDSHSFTLMGTIPAYGFFLIAINNYLGSTDPLEASWPTPDFDCGYTGGSVFANSGDEIRLKDDMGFIIDIFGYGAAAEWYEGTYYPTLPSQGESYERKLGETQPTGGNGIDTDNNADDFSIRLSSEPQNTASASEVPPSQSFYDDVVIGAYGYGNDKGRAYIFYGSSGIPNNASDADIILTGETDNDLFGLSVSGAGDVNSDDYDDVIVGAPGNDSYRGRAYIYNGANVMIGWTQDIKFAHWDESDNAVEDTEWPIQNNQKLAQSFTPDDDYLITKVSVYINGGSSNPARALTIELQGDTGGSGPDDITLAIAPAYNTALSQLTWVEFEFTTPFQATKETKYWIVASSGTNPANQWLWLEDETVSTDHPGGNGAFYGGGTWTEDLSTSDYWFKAYGRLTMEISANVTLIGGAQGDLFGWSVSKAGDIGSDGFDDVIIGAPGTANGNAYIVNGSGDMQDVTVGGIGCGTERQLAKWESGGDFEPAVYISQYLAQSFTPTESYYLTRINLYVETFGTSDNLTVKLEGSTGTPPDTIPDDIVLAQAPSISTGNVSYEWTDFVWMTPYVCTAGTEYFIVAEGTGASQGNCWGWYTQSLGSYAEGDSAFDQGSGWIAYTTDSYFRAYGRPQSVLPNITIEGESPGDMFGYSVSEAGGFYSDVYGDVIVGAPSANGNGSIYIFNGSSSLPYLISASNANYTIGGENPGDGFGWSVSWAGDVNLTIGYDEVLIGAPFHDPGGNSDAGKAYIFSYSFPTPIPPNALPEILDVNAVPNPQVTEEYVNISCNVTDDVEVSSVWVNISLPGGDYNNVSLIKGTGDQWYGNDTYAPLGAYNYVIWANDTSNAWNSSSGHSFTIFDPNCPIISNVMDTPDPQEIGGYVNITCNVSDVGGVFNVWMNMTLPSGGNINISLTKGAGNEWFNNSIYTTLGIYDYIIWANDTSNNWNASSGHSFTIQDTTLPMISNVFDVPDPQEIGGSVNITCDVTDNIGIPNVWVNITLPGGGFTNVSMTKGLGDEWYNNTVYIALGVYDYVIWANDTSNNWNTSSGHSFTIQDTTLPVILNILDIPDPQEAGGSVNITVDVTDIMGIFNVWMNITFPSGASQNVSMTKGVGDSWFNNTIYTILGIYDYVIWTNDLSGNWNSSSGHSFTIQDTTLPVISNVLDTPDQQETGSFVNITCEVTDTEGIFDVWVNITLPSGGNNNISLIKGAGNEWYSNSIYTSLGIYDYVIWANDTSNNWNTSSGHSFTIHDTTLPLISNVMDVPDPQEVVGSVNITCDVTDNIGIFNVWMNITLPGGGYTNLSMTKGLGDEWYNNTVYVALGVYDYVIWVNDSSNNWNTSSGHGFTIQDTTLPVISNVLDVPDPQESGSSVNISCDVMDIMGIYDVWLNITLPSGGSLNVSMTKGEGESWFNNTIYTILGIYDYVIWTNDTSGNWNSSSGHSFIIQDATLPLISNVLDTPDPQETGGFINITCDITDAEGIFEAWVNITLPSGGYINISLTKGAGNEWFNKSIYTILGIYYYVIWANDTSNNWNTSSGHSFTIHDTTLPVISNILDVPDPQEVVGPVNITCDVTDNIGISNVWMNITLPGGGYTNLSMIKGLGDEWYNNTFYVSLGVYDYVIWANDTSNNWNTSSGHSFTIQDTTLPMISNVLDVPDPQEVGGSVNISCDVMDIMGIHDVWLNITLPSGGSLNITMNKGTGDSWFNNTIYTILGIYVYVIWTTDSSGNWNSSSGHSFTILDTTLPIISNVLDTPDPQETGGFVNITCKVTDTMGVFDVWVNISLPGGGYLNASMTKGAGNIWYNEELYWLLGTYDYIIWANDSSGNWNGSFGHSFSVLPGAPFDIIIISGDGQISSVATKLTAPLVVEVRDQYGNQVPNANVWFNVTLGGGTVDIINPVVTNGNGRAQANLTLGTTIGLNTVTAEIAGGSVTQVIFTATGIPGAIYDVVIISGNGQSGVVGMQLHEPMVVEVHDQFGNRVPNADVWFNVTSGGGTVDVTNPVLTGSNGRVQINLTLGTTSGLNTVTAEIREGSITQVLFTATGNPNEPFYIMIISGNGQSGTVGTRLADPFVVEVTDHYGNPVPDTTIWFNTTSGEGSLDITSPIFTDNLGRAQVNLTLGPNAGVNSVTAEISGGGTTQVTFLATGISNKPEIISSISDIEMLEDDPPYSMFLFASAVDDVDLPKDLKWFIRDIDSSLYSVSGQGTNVLVITPKPNLYGNDQVTLLVEDSDGLQDSQPLWINITPVNDKPFFFPEPPDLTITKDISYTFNYAPYLFDIDNNIGELTLTSDDSDHTSVNGHLVTYLYPSSMVNKKVFVTLTLSDGIDASSTVIQINVSEDNVPILKEKLPNVIIYEGEIKYNVFNLDDYFYDPDGDAVYFSYGYSHIIIMINENHSVDFYAYGDWFGEETVTFRARDPGSAIVEDTITVAVVPVNDPPVISDIPDLVVHYDALYQFNLTPYISDADNGDEELSLSFMEFINDTWHMSENINIFNDNNLKMEINYSEMYLGMKFQVRIEVSDGTDSAWDTINITVSEDWPPQLIMSIPDVVFYEDEYISNRFNVHDHFSDRDDDTLFFTYGQEHIRVVIHENGRVDFYAEENWYGIENITVRATDPSGALVEDIITVTVLPVNDAPVITSIPDQEGVLGITWIFDISPYIQDVDNNVTEMVIICDSPYISTVGAVLIFQYPSDLKEDIVQVTVRDPSNADVTTTFNVTLTKTGLGGREELDILQLIWIIILIIAILTTILLLYAYQRGKYEVEEVLLVYRKKGLLVSYKHKSDEVKMDRDLMTGMFTAIQDFVSDVFESDDVSGTPLKVMELGDKKVMIEHGKYTYLAAVFTGGTWRLVQKLKTTLADLEVKYKDVLEDWSGDMEALEGIDTFLEDIVTLE